MSSSCHSVLRLWPVFTKSNISGSKFVGSHFVENIGSFHRLVFPQHVLFFLTFIFDGEHELGRGRERAGERTPSGLHADSSEPDAGLKLTNHEIMT